MEAKHKALEEVQTGAASEAEDLARRVELLEKERDYYGDELAKAQKELTEVRLIGDVFGGMGKKTSKGEGGTVRLIAPVADGLQAQRARAHFKETNDAIVAERTRLQGQV